MTASLPRLLLELLRASRSTPAKSRLENFTSWLGKNGVEILKPGNEWEVLRFSLPGGTGTIWKNKSNQLTWSGLAEEAWQDFTSGQSFRHFQNQPKIAPRAKQALLPTLLDRDGSLCVVCNKPLGKDTSIEHLLDRSFGGSDHLGNLTLAHENCNKSLSACGSLRAKIEHIIKKRSLVCTAG